MKRDSPVSYQTQRGVAVEGAARRGDMPVHAGSGVAMGPPEEAPRPRQDYIRYKAGWAGAPGRLVALTVS